MTATTQTLWICDELFYHDFWPEAGRLGDEDAIREAYELWGHAEALLTTDATRYVRGDAILNLRRAIDQRVRLVGDFYDIDSMPVQDRAATRLEKLALLKVVRPMMLDQLIHVRNLVEHEGAEAPPLPECHVLSEFVWYFLRSTDHLIRSVYTTLLWEDAGVSIELTKLSEQWRIELSGRVPALKLSTESREKWAVIVNATTHSARHENGEPGEVREVDPEFAIVRGEIRGPAAVLTRALAAFLGVP